jgi:hypothetical protein
MKKLSPDIEEYKRFDGYLESFHRQRDDEHP